MIDLSSLKTKKVYDRLGSVRQIINTSASVVRYYTYEPFGEVLEEGGTLTNYMMFTSQYFDSEIDQYYLRARQYDPHINRFTARDPVRGKFEEPLTLHVYLYCINDPVNKIDPWGLYNYPLYIPEGAPRYDMTQTRGIIDYAKWWVAEHGPFKAHGAGGRFDYKVQPSFRFRLRDNEIVLPSEFGNYLTGYTCYYNYGLLGTCGARTGGELYGLHDFYVSDENIWEKVARFMYYGGGFDDWGSKYWVLRGSLEAHIDRTTNLYPLFGARMNPFNKIVELTLRHNMLMCEWFGYIDGISP